jgi:NADH:ubiquinone oxidoreductase subunit E
MSQAVSYGELDAIIGRHVEERGALIPILQDVQEWLGYLPAEALEHISSSLNIPYSEVAGVVSFYSFFSTQPRGRHTVRACLGTACYVRGGKQLVERLCDHLGVSVGDTTADGEFTLEIGRCFGACGLAPVVVIDDDVHQQVKPARAADLLDQYRDEEATE